MGIREVWLNVFASFSIRHPTLPTYAPWSGQAHYEKEKEKHLRKGGTMGVFILLLFMKLWFSAGLKQEFRKAACQSILSGVRPSSRKGDMFCAGV